MAGRTIERRIVTVLFADLVGFTSLSEQLDAEDVALVQDAYFAAVRETIARHGGVLEKFVGDAAMAVFGVPRSRDDDAERAVHAGLALVAAIERLGAQLGLGAGALRLRVGVNTGEAVTGEASGDRGPVTGDTVNVAARLQAAAVPGAVVVGELTALAVAEVVALEPLSPLEVKGKAERVRAQRAVDLLPERSRERALGSLRAPTLGRDRELRRLLDSVGASARVLVVAPPGVGKTRLLSELATAAEGRGACVLRARLRPDVLAPFEPVGQLLQSGGGDVALRERLPPGARAQVVLTAARAAADPAVLAGGERGADERDRLFAAWLEALDALADGRAALWLLEDLHWASADLLAFLAVPAARTLVGTARPSLLETAPRWCADAETIELQPLEPTDAGALVRALTGDALPDDLVGRIVERSDGNPLFIEELLRLWASTGVLVNADDRWRLATDAADVPLPPTVHAIYAGQLDDLAPSARAAAQRGSVAGRRFPLAALDPLGVDEPDAAVRALATRAFVAGPQDDALLGDSYVFRHALLRDAGYASLARGDRATLHLRLARWLSSLGERTAAALAETVARHYAASLESLPALVQEVDGTSRDELRSLAADWFERASDAAFALAAWETARELAERALSLTSADEALARARRLQRLGEATTNVEGVDAATELLREALDAYRVAGAPGNGDARRGLASTGVALGTLLRAQTRFDAAEELADKLLAEIGGGDEARGELLVLRGTARLNARDDADAARADASEALTFAQGPALELDARVLAAQADSEAGEIDDPEVWAKIEELARALGRWETVASSIRIQGAFGLENRPADALALFDASAEVAEAHGLVEEQAWCEYARAETHFNSGDWDAAIACGLRAIDAGERNGFHRAVVRSWFVLLPIATARGRRDLIEQAYPRFAARQGLEPDSPYAKIVSTAAHLHFAAAGLEPPFVPDVDARLVSFELDPRGPSWLAALLTVGDSWIAAGDYDGTARALDRLAARLESTPPDAHGFPVEAILRARLASARGDSETATVEAYRALAFLDEGPPWLRIAAIRELQSLTPELDADAHRLAELLGS